MNSTRKAAVLVLAIAGGAVIAAEQREQMTAEQAMAYAKKMDGKERASMMDQTRQIDDQITKLQSQVRALQSRLAQSPKYFDDPFASSLRP